MRALIDGRSRILVFGRYRGVLAVVAWIALVGGPLELATSNQDRIEVMSSQGVATFEGGRRRP